MTIPFFQLFKLKALESLWTPRHIQSFNKSYWLYLQNLLQKQQNLAAFPLLCCYHPSLLWSIWVLSFTPGRIIEGFPELGREVTLAQSGVLEPTRASSQEPSSKFSGMLHYDWRHSESMSLAMVGIFIPWILADITPGLPPPPPHPTWAILVSHTYHHTTACANLYCVKRTLVSRLSTGVYVCEYTLDHLRNLAYQTAACLNSFKYHNTRKLC